MYIHIYTYTCILHVGVQSSHGGLCTTLYVCGL